MSKPKPAEGPADVGEPCEEGAKVPGDDAIRRNTDGSFPGDANLPDAKAGKSRAQALDEVKSETKPHAAEGRH